MKKPIFWVILIIIIAIILFVWMRHKPDTTGQAKSQGSAQMAPADNANPAAANTNNNPAANANNPAANANNNPAANAN
ncbi:MAG: hypothetical protein KDH94_01890, partial [Coxiellaceae bacterium]|nr:hypothetical protein [Coxiellaceae bacterium]